MKALPRRAGQQDPVMRGAQDLFFNQHFFAPACNDAAAFGLTLPLGNAVVYDSHVQGGWKILSARIGKVNARGEKDWIGQYIQMRREWLAAGKPPVPATVFRMDSLHSVEAGKWDLALPFRVHGVTVTEEALTGGEAPVAGDTAKARRLTTPYLRGDDVKRCSRRFRQRDSPPRRTACTALYRCAGEEVAALEGHRRERRRPVDAEIAEPAGLGGQGGGLAWRRGPRE